MSPLRATVRSTRRRRLLRGALPFLLLGLMLVAFAALPPVSGSRASSFNVYNAMQNWAAFGLVAIGLGVTMIAGEFDLSVLGVFAISGMLAVKIGEHSVVLALLVVIAVAAAIGAAQGMLIAKTEINSMALTLGTYVALLGTTGVLGDSNSVSFSKLNVGETLDATKFEILSWRSLITIFVLVAVVLVAQFTSVGRDVRAVGGERRASRVAGVQVDRVLVGVFVLSAACSALGGALLAFSLATAVPDPGLSPLTFAVTASLLGGVSLVGGSGTALGIAAGALTLSLLQELFSLLATPDYVSNLVTGCLLVLATIVAAPELLRRWRMLRSPRSAVEGASVRVESPTG